ncbi:MAG TPA: SDR family oxidoreductase [Aggregatilineales bacterium]|nr:SDR family oxidoreductase [Aggregatilineales bacterium]
MAHYLVTGGAGFIGSNLVEALLERGHTVTVLDNFSTGRRENLAAFRDRINLVEGDISVLDDARRAVEGVEVVLHQAAIPSVPRSIEDPISSNEANVLGTLNVLVAARDAGVRRVVYASSSSVYGDQAVNHPKVETMTPQPISPYAVGKLAGEYYCQVFHAVYGLETVALRYFNVFGPRQDPGSAYAAVIPLFVSALLRGEPPTVHGDGEQTRDFTFIGNVVAGNLLAAEAPAEQAAGRVFNLAAGQRTSLNELVSYLQEILDCQVQPVHTDPRPGDIKHSWADVDRARAHLGYEPQVGFLEGLRRTVAWYRAGDGRS